MLMVTKAQRKAVDVRAWLEDHGIGRYAEAFASNDVDAEVLRTLTADDLRELGVASLGHSRSALMEAMEISRHVSEKCCSSSARAEPTVRLPTRCSSAGGR